MVAIDQSLGHEQFTRQQGWNEPLQLPSLRQNGAQAGMGSYENVGGGERLVSVASGAILAMLGLGRRDLTGLAIAAVGGGLIYRGATGHCPVYGTFGLDSASEQPHERTRRRRLQANHGTYVSQSFLINRSPEELYSYWRNFENLPRIMTHLKSVHVIDDRRSHWVARAPKLAGGQVEWDAEITADEPNSRIEWRSTGDADVPNTGAVHFKQAPGDRGTAVRVVIDYRPPGGELGRMAAMLFGEHPDRQIREDLRNFKRTMEIGEIVTISGQPRGTCTGQGRRER